METDYKKTNIEQPIIDRRDEDVEETKDYLEPGYKFAEEKKEELEPENKSSERIKVSEQNTYLPDFPVEKSVNIQDPETELTVSLEDEELNEAKLEISQLPDCKMKIPENQQICEKYKQTINESPLTMENTEVFDAINMIAKNKLKKWIEEGLTKEQEKDLRDDDKNNVLENYFNVPPELQNTFEIINNISEKIRKEDLVYNNIVFQETEMKGSKNLFDFLMNGMYFQASDLFKFNWDTNIDTETILSTKNLKYQIGKDITRVGKPLNINDIDVLLSDISRFKSNYVRCDFYNQILMDFMDKYDLIIDKNIISVIDICSIQQLITLLADIFVRNIVKLELIQNSIKRQYSYTIVLTEQEKYIIISMKQFFISLKNLDIYPDFNKIPDSGELVTKLKINFNNINNELSNISDNSINSQSSYSLFVSFNINGDTISKVDPSEIINQQNLERIQRENNEENKQEGTSYIQNMRNVGSNAVEYAKQNPGSVAAAAGVSSVLAAGVGTMFALGILGGKTKKKLHKKRLTRKIIHKNNKKRKSKRRKTRLTKRQINNNMLENINNIKDLRKKLTKKNKVYRNRNRNKNTKKLNYTLEDLKWDKTI